MKRILVPALLLVTFACGESTSSDLPDTETGGDTEATGGSDDSTPQGTSDAAEDSGADAESGGATTADAGTCGNGQLDADEVCDGDAGLEGVSCQSLGHVAGQVACAADCSTIDDSGCSATAVCGDGELSEGEVCEAGVSTPGSCASEGEGSGELACLDCAWSVSSCCSSLCTSGCDDACGADPDDLTGTWTIHFINNGWEGPDPTMIMELAQDGTVLSGSFTTDAWYLGDQEFEDGVRDGNGVYMHVPITQLEGGMIMEGTVCGACSMFGVTDPQGGLNSDWVGTRQR